MKLLLEKMGEHKEIYDTPENVLELYEEIREEFLKKIPSETFAIKHDPYVKEQLMSLIEQIAKSKVSKVPSLSLAQTVKELQDDILGYGPITDYLNDPDIEEIEVNRFDQIWIEKNGRNLKADRVFQNESHLLKTIQRIVDETGRRINESSPMVDGRLFDGSRFNAVISPISPAGACLTIRKFKKKLSLDDLIENGTFPRKYLKFIESCVKARLNIMVTGGSSTGKTNTLNFLSTFVDPTERIVVIEDTQELDIKQPNVVRLESRLPTAEGKGKVSIRDLVINSLRMRPDRIIVGEVRGGEALDMLQAMNTGHDGSMSTGHANSPEDMLIRLESMVLMAEQMNVSAIRHQIAAAIDLIFHLTKYEDGSRKITRVTEILDVFRNRIRTQDILVYKRDYNKKGVTGEMVMENRPSDNILNKLQYYGCNI